MTIKSVLLAPNEQVPFDDPRIIYPKLASVKFDGTRCVCVGGELLTRNMKPQKNRLLPAHLQSIVRYCEQHECVMDMELYDETLGAHGDHTSILSAHEAVIPASMKAHVFDMVSLEEWEYGTKKPFYARLENLRLAFLHGGLAQCNISRFVEHIPVRDPIHAQMEFADAVKRGYEGIMLRCFDAPYKHGRATHKQGIIFKFKQFETIDGHIIEVVQRRKMKEGLDRTLTPTGHMERIHTKDSFELDDMVGAFKVRFEDGTESEVNYGRGFNHETRRQHWNERESLIGRCVEVRHLPHGAKEGIRIGTLVRFRPDKE